MSDRTKSGFVLPLAVCAAVCGCSSELGDDVRVWPTSGTTEPQRLSSSFGPRLQHSKSNAYDFHRGIDIPVPPGSPLYAIAAGEVKRAGDDPAYTDRVIQIEHCGGDGACYFSNYLHITGTAVSIGQRVGRGELVGLSGFGESGFPHLHFEIREERPEQDHCVHPLLVLPTPTWLPPQVTIGPIDDADPAQASVEVTARVQGLFPDLLRIEIATSDRATGAAIEERVFDLDEWNRKYTPQDNPGMIDDPDLENIHVDPAEFNEETAVYTIRLRFGGLTGAAAPGDLTVVARARDVHGNEATAP